MCMSARLRILNIETLGDSHGNFTYQGSLESYVVDYLIVSKKLLSNVLYFHVHPFQGNSRMSF